MKFQNKTQNDMIMHWFYVCSLSLLVLVIITAVLIKDHYSEKLLRGTYHIEKYYVTYSEPDISILIGPRS